MDLYRESISEERGESGARAESSGSNNKEKVESHIPIEDEIFELEKKIKQKREELSSVRRIEGEAEKIGEKNQAAISSASREDEMTEEEKISLQEIRGMSKKDQLEVLLNVALKKGVASSIKIARSLNNAYILDELHDNLVDKLYSELIEKGQENR